MQLLEQGVHTLEQSRRLRLGDVGLSRPEDLRPRQELGGYLSLISSWDAVGASRVPPAPRYKIVSSAQMDAELVFHKSG